jgi:hypothetical protein
MEVFEMKKLSWSEEVEKRKLEKTMTLNMDLQVEEGSFADRHKELALQPLKLLKVLKEKVSRIRSVRTWNNFISCVDGLKLQIGQPVQAVQISKFCLGPLLRIHEQIKEIAMRLFNLSHSS